MSESDVEARLAKEAEITKKALAVEKKKKAIRRSNQLANAKKKQQKAGKSFEQRKLQSLNNPCPSRRNTLPEAQWKSGKSVSWTDHDDSQVSDDKDVFEVGRRSGPLTDKKIARVVLEVMDK